MVDSSGHPDKTQSSSSNDDTFSPPFRINIPPVILELPSGESVKLHYLSGETTQNIAEALEQHEDPKEFTINLIHSLIYDPCLTLVDVRQWPNDHVVSLAISYASSARGLNRPLPGYADPYDEFRAASQSLVEENLQECANR